MIRMHPTSEKSCHKGETYQCRFIECSMRKVNFEIQVTQAQVLQLIVGFFLINSIYSRRGLRIWPSHPLLPLVWGTKTASGTTSSSLNRATTVSRVSTNRWSVSSPFNFTDAQLLVKLFQERFTLLQAPKTPKSLCWPCSLGPSWRMSHSLEPASDSQAASFYLSKV